MAHNWCFNNPHRAYNGPSIPVRFSLLTCFRHTFSPKPVGDVRACSVLKFHCELSISVDNVYTLVSLAGGSTPPPPLLLPS